MDKEMIGHKKEKTMSLGLSKRVHGGVIKCHKLGGRMGKKRVW
jgi:hypothetical protein